MHAVPEAVPDSQFNTVTSAKFTAAHRLLSKDGFDRAFQAEHIADKHFKVFFVRNNKSNARLGIIASKKVLPGAVDRNRIKRVIREAFRQHSIKAQKLDIVVMVRHACAQEPELRNGILKILLSRVENRCAES